MTRQLDLFAIVGPEIRRHAPRHLLPPAPTGDPGYERYGLGPIQDVPRSARRLAWLAGQLGHEIEKR